MTRNDKIGELVAALEASVKAAKDARPRLPDDITTRLRMAATMRDDLLADAMRDGSLLEAADEIVRLRTKIEMAMAATEDDLAEIERLRAIVTDLAAAEPPNVWVAALVARARQATQETP